MKSFFPSRSPQQPNLDEFRDLGFGAKVSGQAHRLVNKDGSFNVRRRGIPFLQSLSMYHTLLRMSWWRFNALLVASFVLVNVVYAVAFVFIGIRHLDGANGTTLFEQFSEAFFFSAQTFTTVGYGKISPSGILANTVATFESMSGWLYFAMAAGLFYGRFSRPYARIIFSRHAVIAPYRGGTAFEFRIANERDNQLIEVEAQVLFTRKESQNGERRRKYYPLNLERAQVTFFPLTWTVVHPIDEGSPLFGATQEMLAEWDAEFLILLKAFDDTFSQVVHTRSSYQHDEIIVGAKFNSIFATEADGSTAVNLHKIHDFERVSLSAEQIVETSRANVTNP